MKCPGVLPTLFLLLLTALLSACGDSADVSPPARPVRFEEIADQTALNTERVCLIGIDALTWEILTPMIAGNELPNIKKLMDRGAHGNFSPADDHLYSPRIWTSIATGKTAEKHGIEFFLIDPHNARHTGKTAGSDLRNCLAIWNILSHFNKDVHVSNYMVSWPAEPIHGTMLSDYFYMDNGTFPPDLQPELQAKYMKKDQRELHLNRLIDRFCPWFAGRRQTKNLSRGETIKLENLLTCLRRDELTLETSLERIRRTPADVSLIYLRSVDIGCHFYWKYSQLPLDDPRLRGLELGLERFGEMIPELYRWADEAVGRIVEAYPENTTFILVSDHGFRTHFNDLRGYNLIQLLREADIGCCTIDNERVPVVTDTADPIAAVRRISLIDERVDAYVAETGIPRERIVEDVLDRAAQIRTVSGKPVVRMQPLEDLKVMNNEELPEGSVRFNIALTPDDTVMIGDREITIEKYIQFLEQSGNHDPTAAIIMAGPHVRRSETIENATALDITPTILSLMDLPVAGDMDGRPIVRAFEPDTWTLHPLTSIDTYEDRVERDVQEMPEFSRPNIVQELKAIGYIQ